MNHNVISVSRMVDDVDVTVGLSLVSILDAIVRIMPKRLHFIRVGNLSNQFIIFSEGMLRTYVTRNGQKEVKKKR